MITNPELDDVLDARPLTERERVCDRCWMAYNAGLTRCPECENLR